MNAHERRLLKRALREAGLEVTPKHPEPKTVDPPIKESISRRVVDMWPLSKLWTGIGTASAAVTLLALYPWFSVDPAFAMKASDPFTESFKIVYDGFVPISRVEAYCGSTYNAGHNIVFGNNLTDGFLPTGDKDKAKGKDVAPWMFHNDELSVTCDSFAGWVSGPDLAKRFENGSKLDVLIDYRFLGVHRVKVKSFKLVSDSSGNYHWQYVP